MILLERLTRCTPLMAAGLLASCGSPASPTANATGTPTVAPTLSQAPSPTPAPASTAAATMSELAAVASMLYPACTPANCAGNAMFTTCDAGSSGPDVFAPCPMTSRLLQQLQQDVNGVPSAPDPLGGGQDPEWTTEMVTTTPSATGGIAHVTLGFGAGTTAEKYDLVVVVQGSQLLVDDVYCTGSDPGGGDVFASGWLNRSVCST